MKSFYDACDRNGIMVWDDFWINSNPNVPYDLNTFNNNVIEKIKRLRNHAAIAVWCGDNEAHPLQPIDDWMATDIAAFDGGDRMYQPRSNAEGLSGSGSWGAFDPRHYFTPIPTVMPEATDMAAGGSAPKSVQPWCLLTPVS